MSVISKTQRDLDLLVLEELEFETACQGKGHARGAGGHTPEQHATHYNKCPVCGLTFLNCAGRATWIRNIPTTMSCRTGCGVTVPAEEWVVERIPGK